MCMKNVNITITPCREVMGPGVSLMGVFDNIVAERDKTGNLCLPKFSLYVNMSIILPEGIEEYDDSEAVKIGATFDVRVILSHVEKRRAVVLSSFPLGLYPEGVQQACCRFWEFHHVIVADDLPLFESGLHTIKVEIRNSQGAWVTQAIHSLNIKEN